MFFKKYFKLHYWPQLTAIWFIITFVITFLLAVLQGHVYIYFPFISDTGTIPPESCIFGQALNIGVIMLLVTGYIRYRQIGYMMKHHKDIKITKKWNTMGWWTVFFLCAGLSIVANFQETNVFYVHLLGAGMSFGFGSIYLCIQTLISFSFRQSYYTHPGYGIGPKLLYFRMVLTILCCILASVTSAGLLISLTQFTGESIAWWTEEHGGFQTRLMATFSEWITTVLLLTYLSTFTNEFKVMEYEEVRFRDNFRNCGEADQADIKL